MFPGGSSEDLAAVAAGIVSAATGTDTGGSIDNLQHIVELLD